MLTVIYDTHTNFTGIRPGGEGGMEGEGKGRFIGLQNTTPGRDKML